VLYFVSAELALGYWLFAFLSALGALQWVAARYRLAGLAFSRSRAGGHVLAALLVVGGAAAFFISQWEAIFAPGPAGSELAVLFGSSAVCALALTLVLAPLLERWRRHVNRAPGSGGDGGQPLTVGHATGYLYIPAGDPRGSSPPGATALAPAVCLLPACPVGMNGAAPAGAGRSSAANAGPMAILARRLAAEGVVALAVNPDAQSYAYPAILATLPAAVAVLRGRPEVDPNRIGALGEDLGGDLVIRAASTSKEIRAVVALAPILAPVPAGLGLLREMSYCRAMRWARDRRRASLCRDLNAAECRGKIPPRPLLLLYGEEDRLVGDAPMADSDSGPAQSETSATVSPAHGREAMTQLQVIPGLGHFGLAAHPMVMRVVSQWLKEHL